MKWIKFEITSANIDIDKLSYDPLLKVRKEILDNKSMLLEYISCKVDIETDTNDWFDLEIYDIEYYETEVDFQIEIVNTKLKNRVLENEKEAIQVINGLRNIFKDLDFKLIVKEKEEKDLWQ